MVVMILNAIYFKGTWRRQFATNETKEGTFYVTPNVYKRVQFMRVKDKFFFKESTKFDAKILRMPYRVRIKLIVGIHISTLRQLLVNKLI